VEVPGLYVLKISHIDKFPGKVLVQPPLPGCLPYGGRKLPQESVELDFRLEVLSERHGHISSNVMIAV